MFLFVCLFVLDLLVSVCFPPPRLFFACLFACLFLCFLLFYCVCLFVVNVLCSICVLVDLFVCLLAFVCLFVCCFCFFVFLLVCLLCVLVVAVFVFSSLARDEPRQISVEPRLSRPRRLLQRHGGPFCSVFTVFKYIAR